MSRDRVPVDEAAEAIGNLWNRKPHVGIILGTGMGTLVSHIQADVKVPFESISYFPVSTALSHKGQLVCGELAGATVIAMDGRCHAYEGYSVEQITLPIRVMSRLGVRLLIVGNASGAVNPNFAIGDIVLLDSHINLMGRHLVNAVAASDVGRAVRLVSSPYDPRLIQHALEIARRANFVAHRGVYVAVTGPNYETRAEYRFFRQIGGDVIGMSTVPEVIVAAHLGLRVLAISTVTNVAIPDALTKTDAHEVVSVAAHAEAKVREIVTGILADEVQKTNDQP